LPVSLLNNHTVTLMNDDVLYQVALTMVPQIGHVHASILVKHFESAVSIFAAKKRELECIPGIGAVRATAIKKFDGFDKARAELAFIEKYKITPLFLSDINYPQRLLQCYDPPTLLFYRGKASLNAGRIVAIVGTRNKTEYGKQQTEKLVEELAKHGIMVVSGLALGIDAIAHKASVKNKVPTIGVVAHGLDSMYPPDHTALAKEMVREGGGILTEFRRETKPDKHNFPIRNRIVAGMCDALVVIETDIKGGSMITAELAYGYNKDVFAIPGKNTDRKSAGCNHLIKQNKAMLLTDAHHLLDTLGWVNTKPDKKKKQKELFIQLTEQEEKIVKVLQEKGSLHIDELHIKSGLNSSAAAAAILNLELQQIICSLPGKIYQLL